MQAHELSVDKMPRIAIALRSPGNARLIRQLVADRAEVMGEPRLDDAGRPAFELAVVDVPNLQRMGDALERWRAAAEPVVLPVLLVADERGDGNAVAQRALGRTVDDVLRVPSAREEVVARIDNLLRLGRFSREQQARYERTSQALEGANRALRTLHIGNEVLVRARNEQQLLDEICRVVVEQDRYALAWAGFVQSGNDPEIVIDAHAGDRSGYVDHVRLLYSQVGNGPAWQAVEQGRAVVVTDLAHDPAVRPLWTEIREYGLGSAITLPIRPESGAAGVLAIYSQQRGDFDKDERNVLERLGANIEYGLNALRVGHERDRQKEAIRNLAYHDSLTNLPNRNSLVERLDGLLAEGSERSAAVLFVDLDHFKIINDALGHMAGDEVLRQVAQRLQQVLRPEDFVARQGGDEFIVVMAEPPRSAEWREASEAHGFAGAAMALGERLAARLREPLIVEDYERRLGASVGIGLYPDHAATASDLIDCADTAMYAAKGSEQSVQVYSPGISRRRERRLSIEGRLYKALEAGEFEVHYQPVFELTSGRIEGAEALVRWPQPGGGYLSPGEFMPVAEESGLIVPIGEWVLRTAVAQRAEWLREGHDLMMAVNVSVRQLRPEDAADGLLEAIGQAVDPTRIELEVTESELMDEGGRISETLETLHDRGLRVAVDDFGTGHSSLSRLQAMPISTLKIDKSFVADLGQAGRGAVIARSVQHLADGLGVRCLAEGVETDEQRAQLIDLGCPVAQGFWLSGAVPADAFLDMVRGQAGDA